MYRIVRSKPCSIGTVAERMRGTVIWENCSTILSIMIRQVTYPNEKTFWLA